MKILPVLCLVLSAMVISHAEDPYPLRDSLNRFMYRVAMYDKDYSNRWLTRPQLTVDCSDPVLKREVEALIQNNLNKVLLGAEKGGELILHVGETSDLREISKDLYNFPIRVPDPIAYIFWRKRDSSLEKMVLLIPTDTDINIRRLIAMASMNGLGLFPDDKAKEESLLSYKENDLLQMTPLDERMLRFFYQHVPPGSDRKAIRLQLEKFWANTAQGAPVGNAQAHLHPWVAKPEEFKGKEIEVSVATVFGKSQTVQIGAGFFVKRKIRFADLPEKESPVHTIYVAQNDIHRINQKYSANLHNGGIPLPSGYRPDDTANILGRFEFEEPKPLKAVLWQLEEEWILVVK